MASKQAGRSGARPNFTRVVPKFLRQYQDLWPGAGPSVQSMRAGRSGDDSDDRPTVVNHQSLMPPEAGNDEGAEAMDEVQLEALRQYEDDQKMKADRIFERIKRKAKERQIEVVEEGLRKKDADEEASGKHRFRVTTKSKEEAEKRLKKRQKDGSTTTAKRAMLSFDDDQ